MLQSRLSVLARPAAFTTKHVQHTLNIHTEPNNGHPENLYYETGYQLSQLTGFSYPGRSMFMWKRRRH